MPETANPLAVFRRGGLLLLSPGATWANRWPQSGPVTPQRQCLILHAWTLLIVGVLFPLLLLHRMERMARLSAAGVVSSKGDRKRWWFLTFFLLGMHVWSAACIVFL